VTAAVATPSSRRRRVHVAVALALLLGGCSGIPQSELPDRVIALRWFDAEALRSRGEIVDEAYGQGRTTPQGMPSVDDFKDYMGRILGVAGSQEKKSVVQQQEERFPGRMVLGDARTGSIRGLGLVPGTVPRARSPDGGRLIFTQLVDGLRQLFLLKLDGGEIQRLTRGPSVHADGCFGPEGRFVFVATDLDAKRPRSRLVITGPGGNGRTVLTEGPSDYAPACAPDGSSVVWAAVTERGQDVLMSRSPVLGGEVRRLGPGRDPAFSPDSEWVVYTARIGRRWALHRVRPDGSGRRRVGPGDFNAVQPSFSPDGRLVIYVSDTGSDQRFHVRRFDGTGDRVLFTDGGGTDPVW